MSYTQFAALMNDQRKESCKEGGEKVRGTLIQKNLFIFDKRTSIRLEKEMWDAFKDVADMEGCSINDIASLVYLRKKPRTSLTAAIRVFLLLYFKAAATKDGHMSAGHGSFYKMQDRAKCLLLRKS